MFKSSYPVVAGIALLSVPSISSANVKGQILLDMELGVSGGRELAIREPEMCANQSTAEVKWNRNQDFVDIKLDLKGIPYQPTFCFDVDPSTPYNQYPACTVNGIWQVWFTLRMFTRTSIWYYDVASGDLVGNEHDLVGGPPPGSVPVDFPAAQMLASNYFQPNPGTHRARVTLHFAYEEMLDMYGGAGSIVGIVPFNIYDEDSVWIYYTKELLPLDEAQTWDTVLAEINLGIGGFGVASSAEPQPKPLSLLTHDQLMIGWAQSYPDQFLEPHPENFTDPDCGTEQVYVPFI